MNIFGDANAVLKDLHAQFEDTVRQTRPNNVPEICMEVESDGAYEKYAFPTAPAWPRLFVDQRSAQGVDVNAVYQVDNNTYELTLEFKKELLDDARAYNVGQVVREAAMSAVLYPDYLLSQLVANGNGGTALAYDGNPFYGDTHLFANAGSTNIDNSLAASGTSLNQLQTDFEAAVAAIRGYKDNQGRLINPVFAEGAEQLVVHCPLAQEMNWRRILNSAWMPVLSTASGENILRGIAKVIPDGYLSGSAWFLHYVGMPLRPFVFQNREALSTTVLGPNSEHCQNTGKVRILARQRFRLQYMAFYRSARTA